MALSNFYWDQTAPANSLLIADIPQAFRHVVGNTEAVITNEHTTLSDSSNVGAYHKQGSARAFFQDAEPATRINGEAFTADDYGSIWFDSNDNNEVHVLTNHSPVTWTPLVTDIFSGAREFDSTLNVVGNLSVATNKFVVAAATGNTTIAGTAAITGTLAVTGKATVDETETTDSDATVATKGYVDSVAIPYKGATLQEQATWETSAVSFSNGLRFTFGASKDINSVTPTGTYTVSLASDSVVLCVQSQIEESGTTDRYPLKVTISGNTVTFQNTNSLALKFSYLIISCIDES